MSVPFLNFTCSGAEFFFQFKYGFNLLTINVSRTFDDCSNSYVGL
jgi:hypothetical protein